MGKTDIEIFIDIITKYFATISDDKVFVETPFLADTAHTGDRFYDYTKRIGISGEYDGSIVFSATRDFLKDVIRRHNQEDYSDPMLNDAAGEVANVLSGNAREKLGHEFVISVPHSYDDEDSERYLSGFYSFVIPMVWRQHTACLILGVNSQS